MSKQELLDLLKKFDEDKDPESAHGLADQALLDYINDKEITEAYDKIIKWYA